MFRSAIFSLALFFSVATAYADDFQILVENGTPVPASARLSRTAALLSFSNHSFCSSSFLSARTILTAGHCISGKTAANVQVMVRDPNGNWVSRAASAVALHPNFRWAHDANGSDNLFSDLAIVQISQPFPFAVGTVTLTSPAALQSAWAQVTDVGYGFSSGSSGGRTLRSGSMWGILARLAQLGNSVGLQQAKSGNQIACPGDSGGPVLIGNGSTFGVVAVHSLSNGCSASGTSTYSTLVWPERAWLQSMMR